MLNNDIMSVITGGTCFCDPATLMTTGLQPMKREKMSSRNLLSSNHPVEITDLPLFNVDSTNLTPAHATAVALEIHRNLESFDGFILITGTDTMDQFARRVYLSFQKRPPKPIIITGSMRSLYACGSDAQRNFCGAVTCCLEMARSGLADVLVWFADRAFFANRIVKRSATSDDAFHSPGLPVAGKLTSEGIQFSPSVRRSVQDPDFFQPYFDPNVEVLALHDGICPERMRCWFGVPGLKGVVIQTIGEFNVPDRVVPVLRAAGQIIPIVATSHFCGETDLDAKRYAVGCGHLLPHVIPCVNLTTNGALVTLQWLLAQQLSLDAIREEIKKIDESECPPLNDLSNLP